MDSSTAKSDPICKISGLRHSFGGLIAVDIDRLEIQRGIITAIIGPNGAGKTTLFNIITGFQQPDEGSWSLDDILLEDSLPYQIARAGMIRTFQLTKTLDRLTVMDNILLASQMQRGEQLRYAFLPKWRSQEEQDRKKALGLLENYGLLHMKDHYSSTLSGGQRKLLEMSRALMCEPKIILLDEPLAGVSPALVENILGHMRDLAEAGITVVFVEHNIDAVAEISDWVVCLSEGRVIAEGTPQTLTQNQAIIDAYLGR